MAPLSPEARQFILIMLSFLIAALATMLLHELGHLTAATLLGYPAYLVVHRMGVGTAWGSDHIRSTPGHRVTVALAGPAASFLTGGLFLLAGQPVLAFTSFMIGGSNLIPFPGSDGRHAWRYAVAFARAHRHLTRIA